MSDGASKSLCESLANESQGDYREAVNKGIPAAMSNLLFAMTCTSAAESKITVKERNFYLEDINGNKKADLLQKKVTRNELFTRVSKIFTACQELEQKSEILRSDKIR